MHNSKTCCLEQSDGQNFPLLYSQSNAEKAIWSQKSLIRQSTALLVYMVKPFSSCLPLLFRVTKKIAMTSTNQHRRNESSDAFPARNHERCSKLTHFHALTFFYLPPLLPNTSSMITVDCRFLGISVITWCTMDPNTTNSIPHVRKSHANLPKRETKWEKLLRCPVKVVLKRSRSRSTFHFSKSSCPFIQY